MDQLRVTETEIAGLWQIDLEIHEDERGSFCPMFHAEKFSALGLPEFHPVQTNIVHNRGPGIVRGFHAEPWDKLVHIPVGSVFAAIADLRPISPTYKKVWTKHLSRRHALFVSRGLGNGYQVTSGETLYIYQVNGFWRPGILYPGAAWNDPELNVQWPLPVDVNLLSERDRALPYLTPIDLS